MMTQASLAALAVLSSLLAAGCTTAATNEEIRTHLAPGSVLMPVPRIPEEGKGSCGLDCVVSLLRYNGLDLDDEGRRRFPPLEVEKRWIPAGELREYLVFRGFRAVLVHGTLDEARPAGLFMLLEAGLPVIVERTIDGTNHFDLVCGFEPVRRFVFIMLPEGVGAVPYDKFERSWAVTDRLTLVAAPESKIGGATTAERGGQ